MRSALFCLLLSAPALGAVPEDISPSLMGAYQSVQLQGTQTEAWVQLVEELGAGIANKGFAPAETLGAMGFDLSGGSSFVFHRPGDDDAPSPWETSHPAGDPGRVLSVPHLAMRKGLPYSLEVGLDFGWLAMSRQGSFGGYTRVSPWEGYKPWPDLTFQLGYAGYVGNDEFDLSVMDLGASIGSTYAFGSMPGLRSAQFSPWFSTSLLSVRANPTFDPELEELLGVVPIGTDADNALAASTLFRLGAGFQITNGTFFIRLLGTWVPGALPVGTLGMGFSY